jgi:4-amino-4-deoxy-L-arabinose transferase-like glycosyltransferase
MSPRVLGFILFFATLLIYVAATVIADRPDLIWDEARYKWFATSLTHGTYCTPEKPDVINGPGYPLVLAPLIAAGAPLIVLRGLNALFMALAALFSFRAVLPYAGKKWALGVALLTALHPSVLRVGPYLMTEALSLACIAGFAWAFTAALRSERWSWGPIVAAGFALGWLTLTRVFFGNVIMAATCFLVLMLMWKSIRARVLRALAVLALAFTMCVPWLAYTKSWTGETLCWSTNAGELLYWATSTHEGENGHWFSEEDSQNKPELVANGHRDFYKANYYLPVKEREAALKKKAMANLRANPKGVLKNWICNWGRLIVGFPRSYYPEELLMLVLVAVNGPIVLALLLALVVAWRNRRKLPFELLLLGLLTFIYLGGTSLLPGLPRYAIVVWPWIGLCMAGVLSKGLRIDLDAEK